MAIDLWGGAKISARNPSSRRAPRERNNFGFGILCQYRDHATGRETLMKYLAMVGIVLASALVMPVPASARLGTAPASTLIAQDDAVIQVKGGHGHGRGH